MGIKGSKMPFGVTENYPRRAQDVPKRAQDGPKRSQKRLKPTPRGAQEGRKSEPKPQDERRTEPRRSQGCLGPPTGRFAQLSRPPGSIRDPKRHQNRPQNDQTSKQKFKTKKNRPKTNLDLSWQHLGSILAPPWPNGVQFSKKYCKPACSVNNHFLDDKTV